MTCENSCGYVSGQLQIIEVAQSTLATCKRGMMALKYIVESEIPDQTLEVDRELLGGTTEILDFYGDQTCDDKEFDTWLAVPEMAPFKEMFYGALAQTDKSIATAMGNITLAQESCHDALLICGPKDDEDAGITLCTSEYLPAAGSKMQLFPNNEV